MKIILQFFSIVILTIQFPLTAIGQENEQQVYTSDIDHFWQAYDSIQTLQDPQHQINLMQQLYIDKGTIGLKMFMEARHFGAKELVEKINAYPRFWRSIRPNTYLIKTKEAEINTYVQKFQKLYPEFRKAAIYFSISAINSGGTVKDSIVMIGSEIATGNSETEVSEFPDKRLATFFSTQISDYIVPITIHEYVHTQQKREGKSLLGQSISEGACDFITELVLGTELKNAYILYGKKHESELKNQYRKEMFSADFSNWLYNGSTSKTVGDLGYFMGYSICKSYYNIADNKKKAIADIIELDYGDTMAVKDFLTKSEYYNKK